MKSLDHAAAIEKLRIMRRRLETALERFYGHDLTGDPIAMQAAALDIATPIRVMVHHVPDIKPPSICLLYQVDPEYWRKRIHFKPLIAQPPKSLPSGVKSVNAVGGYMADQTHKFKINELKCSETGENYAPQVYIDGTADGRTVSMWFATRPGISHDEVHSLVKHMHSVLETCQVQIERR